MSQTPNSMGAGNAGTAKSRPTAADLPAPNIAPEGVPIIIAFFAIGGLLSAAAVFFLHAFGGIVAFACVLLCAWCVWFFRDPKRAIPVAQGGEELIISPADGVISYVGPAAAPKELGVTGPMFDGLTRVSVFMNVFNVHVNRSPIDATVEKTVYTKGLFVNASLDKASEHNERMGLLLKSPKGYRLVVVQIAGLVARRIVCRVGAGVKLIPGQRFGIIRFGSRVDVYLPKGVESLVKVGDRSVAGETIFAVIPAGQSLLTNPPASSVAS